MKICKSSDMEFKVRGNNPGGGLWRKVYEAALGAGHGSGVFVPLREAGRSGEWRLLRVAQSLAGPSREKLR